VDFFRHDHPAGEETGVGGRSSSQTWNQGGDMLTYFHPFRSSSTARRMQFSLRGSIALMGVFFPFGEFARAELDPPFNTSLVGSWDGWSGGLYADVYGEGDYAFLAHFGDAGMHILDISNPAAPFFVAEVRADPPNDFASCQDVKTGDGMLFIALESNSFDRVLICDITDPTNPIKRTLVNTPQIAPLASAPQPSQASWVRRRSRRPRRLSGIE